MRLTFRKIEVQRRADRVMGSGRGKDRGQTTMGKEKADGRTSAQRFLHRLKLH